MIVSPAGVILLLAAGFFAQLRVAIAACGFLLPARHKRRIARVKTKGTYPMPSLADYVDSLLSKLVTSETPGCALAIVERGEVVHSRGYGLADHARLLPQ